VRCERSRGKEGRHALCSREKVLSTMRYTYFEGHDRVGNSSDGRGMAMTMGLFLHSQCCDWITLQ
jgi:hypothetical protein